MLFNSKYYLIIIIQDEEKSEMNNLMNLYIPNEAKVIIPKNDPKMAATMM